MDLLPSADAVVYKSKSTVEQMSIGGDEPPSEYIVKDSFLGYTYPSSSLSPFPIIDIALLSNPSSGAEEAVDKELEKLKSALSSSGCFQVFLS